MIPVERVTELLLSHWFGRWQSPEGQRVSCSCGWESPPTQASLTPGIHAAHVAGVLADAGLIPTTKEWAVRFTSYRKHQLITTGHRNDELWIKRYAEDLRRQEFATDVQVVTRYVGAAEWVPVGE